MKERIHSDIVIWKPVKDKCKYGVVIDNFNLNADGVVHLSVGDTVHILEELGNWYFGYVLPSRSVQGIFPKSFIHVKDCFVDRTGQFETVAPRIPPIIQELTAALREWGLLTKTLFANGKWEFREVYDTMNQLILARKKMLSGSLLVEEIKHFKHEITDNIDRVNQLLGLDLVVRDEQGNILNPDITSTVTLFRHHLKASEKLSKNHERRHVLAGNSRQKSHNAWTVQLTIKNIILKVPDPCDVSLAFYMWDPLDGRDGREGKEKLLTEPYVFNWTPVGYAVDTDLYSNLVALYTDLSSKIVMQDKQIFLMGTVIREGSMVAREVDRRTSLTPRKTTETDSIRRPFGIFMADVSEKLKRQREASIHNNVLNAPCEEVNVPFYPCGEKDSIESLVRKNFLPRNDLSKENSSLGMWVNLSLLNGDIKQLRKENPHYTPIRELPVSYPLSLSDVVVPGDVRNDLYVTLVSAEFSKFRNVEVMAKVCDENGCAIPGVIYIGCGRGPLDFYRSATYQSEPRWMETFKVALPIQEFRKAHLKLILKHRSTNELKDRNERPFAIAFARFIQPNGTTLLNTDHDLLIYKVDGKKWSEEDSSYLKFPCVRLGGEELQKKREETYVLSTKDSIRISTVFCSTKLTQKAELLSLLEWGGSGLSSKTDLRRHLTDLRHVPPEEVIIFLQDTLDVLFEILMNVAKDTESNNLVFEALVDVVYMAGELNKHEAYQSVLETYIQENFHATLAYGKLISILSGFMNRVSENPSEEKTSTLNRAMKCLPYLVKFIVYSRRLFLKLHGEDEEPFKEQLTGLLDSIITLMSCTSDALLSVQGHCLKCLPLIIPDLASEYNDNEALCHWLINVVNSLKNQRLSPQRLNAVCDVIYSPLFADPQCRAILLEAFVAIIKKLFTENEELKLCVKILCDILDLLFGTEVGPTLDNLMLLLHELLQDILAIISKMRRDDDVLLKFVAVFISLLRQIPDLKFLEFLESFNSHPLIQYLADILMVIQDLIENPVFCPDWSEMIFLQNFVIKKVLSLISKVIIDRMKEPFMDTIWNNFFHTAVKFITQPCLQLERFSSSKRTKVVARYRDLRLDMAMVVKQLWFSLGGHKIRFIVRTGNGYSLVGPFLEMTLLPVAELRRSAIPIFFDMMQCEFYSHRDRVRSEAPDMARRDERIKGKFDEFERDMLENLDHLIEGGCGDEHYKEVFVQLMTSLCKEHSALCRPGFTFVTTMGRLMEKLLQYRAIMNAPDHSPEIRMSCTVSLLDFYAEINRKELYLRYVYKLFDLHCECDNYTEAGYTLLLHANLLSWKHSFIPGPLKCPRHLNLHYQDDLKEKLYHDIILNFEKGKMWEAALKICKELIQRYEDITMEYDKLSKLLSDMAKFYRCIMDPQIIRPEPEYFRVAYYGRGFPAFLQNKVFIYRGNGFERLSEFQSRILDPFPNAEVMMTLSAPSPEDMESPKQLLQVNKVDCVPEDTLFMSSQVAERIRLYHRVNHVDVFSYSRPFHRGLKDPDNEFATLWTEKTTLKTIYSLPGVLRCFPVESEAKVELTPLDNALVSMTTNNQDLESLIRRHITGSSTSLEPLTRKLSGMVDAAVMGGIKNYEKAFLNEDYVAHNPQDVEKIRNLKQLISQQIPLLELALEVHGCSVSTAMQDLHSHMAHHFKTMKMHLQSAYGVSMRPLDLESDVQIFKRQTSQSFTASHARSSHYSVPGSEPSFTSGLLLPRISLAVSKNAHSTLPRGMRLSSSSVSNLRKERKGFKYLRNRRDSLTSKKESSSTKWFESSFGEDSSPFESPVQVRHKISSDTFTTPTQKDSSYFSRPDSLKSEPSDSSIERRSLEEDMGNAGAPSNPARDTSSSESPPPLPVKARNDKTLSASQSLSQRSSLDNDSDSTSAPEKPPRNDLNGLSSQLMNDESN